MYWRGLPAQEKVKYSLLLITLILLYSSHTVVLYKSSDERDCDLLVTLAKRQARGLDNYCTVRVFFTGITSKKF